MLELIQGEGGVMALDPDYVQAVRKLCDEKDLVLIVDEVQTGVGRTGTFLCCEHYNLKPDVVTLAKGLGGGLPIGAVLMNEKVAESMGPGTHGSTFGGNPVVCAGANVVVDRMDQSFLANVNERAAQLLLCLELIGHIQNVGQLGRGEVAHFQQIFHACSFGAVGSILPSTSLRISSAMSTSCSLRVSGGSSMANSLIVGGLLAGMQVTCVCPQSYRPAADVLMFAHKYGSAFHLTADPAEGIQDADVVATAVWNTAKPGTPESEQRLRDFVGFQLTGKLLESAKPDVMVLHCLPAHRGEEISSAVFEQHAPEIFDEAENRLHVQKAVLAILLAGK